VRRTASGRWALEEIWKRGYALLGDPLLNKGTAFSAAERELFDLEGLLPTEITNRSQQVRRAYEHVKAKGHAPIEMYIAMAALQDRNETLFYQVLDEHTEELIPIVYTPTVGSAALSFSHLFRRGRGLWITPDHRGRIFEILGHARSDEIRLIVVTDNERILGLGDQGAGGMVIPVGKLALYTLAAGIHPAQTLPVSLDVGTDNQDLLDDPLYVGWPHRRLRGTEYESFVDEFVDGVRRRWPGAVLQWEDFKKANAFRLLDRYRASLPSFNDDIQGTGAVTAAGILAACRATGTKLGDHRVLLVGSGAAGVGIARQLADILTREGLDSDDLQRVLFLVDSRGLVIRERPDLEPYKADFAVPATDVAATGSSLEEIVAAVKPTVLVGTTGQPGVFTEQVVGALARHADRPVVLALSNPTSKTEAHPQDVMDWTGGRALIATGSPFDPVTHGGRMVPVPQCNNVYVFPGVGLGTLMSGATSVTDAMFTAAARALAEQVSDEDLEAGFLYPPLDDLRSVSLHVARAVVAAAVADGVARPMTEAEIDAAIDDTVWDLDYPELRPV
jgi:malate dehydrogenase (oxaloacetate-decarboxylating)